MDVITLLLIIIAIGVVVWVVKAYVPMDPAIKRVLTIAAVVITVILLLSFVLGVIDVGNVGNIRVGN